MGKKQFLAAVVLATLVSGSAWAATVDEDTTYNGKVTLNGGLEVDSATDFHRDVTVGGGSTFQVEEGGKAVFNGDVAMNGNVKFDEKADFRHVNTRSISFYTGPNIGGEDGNTWYGEINDKNMILEVDTFLHRDLQVEGETYSKGGVRTDGNVTAKNIFVGKWVDDEWQGGFYATADGRVGAKHLYGKTGSFSEGLNAKELLVGSFNDKNEFVTKAGIDPNGIVYGDQGIYDTGVASKTFTQGYFDENGKFISKAEVTESGRGRFQDGVETTKVSLGTFDSEGNFTENSSIDNEGNAKFKGVGQFQNGVQTTKVELGTFDARGNFTKNLELGNDGNASFSGDISAANGTFTGDVSGANGTFTGDVSAANGTFSGDVSAANGHFSGKVTAKGMDAGKARVENVADAQKDTDAVNFRQLKEVSRGVADSRDFTKQTGAMSAALAGLNPMAYDPCSPTEVLASVGTYKGETAFALGVSHYTDAKTRLGAGISYSDGDFMGNVNVAFKVGSGSTCRPGSDTDERIAQLERELAELRAMVAAQAK